MNFFSSNCIFFLYIRGYNLIIKKMKRKLGMKKNRYSILYSLPLILFQLISPHVSAQNKAIENSGDALYYATPVVCLATTLLKKDYQGTKQLVFSAVTAVGVSYILKHTIRKERPDGSDHRALPSGHATVTFQGASFLQRRYGWKYGIPAYLLSGYVAWTRIHGDKHDWWDILTGAAIGVGSTYIFTKPYGRTKITLSPTLIEKRPGIHACITF